MANLLLIQAAFHGGDRFWVQENWCPKKNFFSQDKFYSLKAHAHHFSHILSYLKNC